MGDEMELQMNIRQAARWAQQKDCLYRTGRDGHPDYMYAVTRMSDHAVVCLGYYEKCAEYIKAHTGKCADYQYAKSHTGEWLRNYCLDEVLQDMDESEGESRCYLGQREEGVSWAAC